MCSPLKPTPFMICSKTDASHSFCILEREKDRSPLRGRAACAYVKKKFFNKFQIPRSGLQCYSSMIQSPFIQVVVIIVVNMYACASLFSKITRSIQKSRSGEDAQQSELTHHSGGRRKRAQRHDVNA